jgi:predicted Zn-dependent protease
MKRLKFTIQCMLGAAILFLVTYCAVNPVTGKSQIMLISEEQEIKMGKEYDPQVIATFGEYKNDALLAFITEKGNAMAKISHRPKLQFHFRILDSPVINAFAVPGGYVYFTRGILAQLNSEAELVGVLGHEMGHITARHTAVQQSKQQLGQLLLIGGMIASEKFAQYAQPAMQGMQLLFLKYGRDDERQSDRLGVHYMSMIGYDANKMADFFQVLDKMSMASDHGGIPTFMSTHPDPGDRFSAVQQNARMWQDSIKGVDWKVNTESYLKLIDGIIYGEDPRQGYTENNIFYHPELKFRFGYPSGWQFQNSPMQVAMAPSDGKALILFMLAGQKTPEEAAAATNKQFGLTVVDMKNVTTGGIPALAVLARQTQKDKSTGQQQTNMILSYYINYDGRIYTFHGISTETDFTTYRPHIEATLSSFNRLTDPAKINVKPKKIMVRAASDPGSLSQVLASLGVPEKDMKELALLNNMELTDKVDKGRLLKLIGE